jgi:hypothetical protein
MNKALLLLLVFVSSCSSKPKKEETKTAKEEKKFFDIKHYINSDLEDIKRTPYYIYKLDVVNGKQDSVTITPTEAIAFAQGFLQPDINDPSVKEFYKESIFEDQTINSFTVSYTTTNKELPVQNLDVILKEDGKTVKRLFIRKFYNENDVSRVEQWGWKPGQSFEVNRLITEEDKPEISHRTRIVWNEKPQ